MLIERKKNSARNALWGVMNKLLTLGLGFAVRTIILYSLGDQYLGLGSLFSSILQVLSLSELGFASAIVFMMYKPLAEGDDATVSALLSFYKRIYRIIGIIVLFVGVVLMPFLPNLISGEVTVDANIYVIYAIYLANTVISYCLFAYKSALLQANQRDDIDSKIAGVINIAMNAVQIVILLLFKDYYKYIIMLPIFTVLWNIVRAMIVDKLFPQFKAKGKLPVETQKEIWSKVKSLFIYKIGNVVSNSADQLVITAFLGLAISAMYGNYYYIISALFGFLTIYYTAIRGALGNSAAVETVEKNKDTLNTLFFLQSWIIGWCSVCLLCLFQPFMTVWVGESYLFDFEVVVLLVLYFYSWKINDIVYTYKEAVGLWEPDKYRPLISAVFNLVVNIILVQFIGIYGIIVSTILSDVLITLPWAPRVLFKHYFKSPAREYYVRLLVYTLINAVVAAATFAVCTLVKVESIYADLAIKMLICVFLPNVLYILLNIKNKSMKKSLVWLKSVVRR